MHKEITVETEGSQRLSMEKLNAWEDLGYGMFIHFGMSTFADSEFPSGIDPSHLYAPNRLDVDQWVSIARDAGMQYAVLTTKHVAGHCLWPSKYTDYHVGTSGNKTDVVEAFVEACAKRGIRPGFYYCSWDNHHTFGSVTPSLEWDAPFATKWHAAFTTREYQDFQTAQINELLTQYGDIAEIWIDIPHVLGRGYREDLYRQIATLQPDILVAMNHGLGEGDGATYNIGKAWPSDIVTIERCLPSGRVSPQKWRNIEGKSYYMPMEVCETLAKEWFYVEDDVPRSDEELLGIYLLTLSRKSNLLLDVGPDKSGRVPKRFEEALKRLRKNIDRNVSYEQGFRREYETA